MFKVNKLEQIQQQLETSNGSKKIIRNESTQKEQHGVLKSLNYFKQGKRVPIEFYAEENLQRKKKKKKRQKQREKKRLRKMRKKERKKEIGDQRSSLNHHIEKHYRKVFDCSKRRDNRIFFQRF